MTAPTIPEGWKPLTDVQWMNIVNHDRAYDQWGKEDAVHHAAKMTEAKLKEINTAPAIPLPAAPVQGWVSVKDRLPEVDVLVMVYSPPNQYDHEGDVHITFDYIDPNDDDHASWYGHNEFYEHFCCVAKPEGSVGPSEKAPYTHWMPLPPPPVGENE